MNSPHERDRPWPEHRTLLLLLVAVSCALGWILLPFYGTLLWSAIIALLFAPLHRRLLLRLKRRRTLAAPPGILYRERYERFLRSPAWQVLTSAAYDQEALDTLLGNGLGTRDGETADGDHSPFALALFAANQLTCGHSALIKYEFSRVNALVAEFFELSASAKGITFFNKK